MNRFAFLYSSVIFLLFLASIPTVSEAASLYIDPATSILYRGDSISMAVRLDTDEANSECINAVDTVLTYTDNIFPVDISVGSSILSVWVEPPVIDKESKTITFAGGIPNGYCGRIQGDPRLTNILAEIVFRSPGFAVGGSKELTGKVDFASETTAYLNDGRGTKAKLNTYGATIELDPKAGSSQKNEWKDEIIADKIPPEEFSISLQRDEKAFSQKHYIVFNTTDKQTGIDHYEIMEESLTQFGSFQWGRADAPWTIARSPYVLEDQSLNTIIRVKAVDKAGNEYLATLIPDESARTLSDTQVMVVVSIVVGILTLIILVFVGLYLVKRRRKQIAEGSSTAEENEVDNDSENQYDESD